MLITGAVPPDDIIGDVPETLFTNVLCPEVYRWNVSLETTLAA